MTHIMLFSPSHFRRVKSTFLDTLIKNGCFHGCAVVPGPFVDAYALPNSLDAFSKTKTTAYLDLHHHYNWLADHGISETY